MDINSLTSKKVAILGLGIEGIALANFLDGKCASVALLDRMSEVDLKIRAENESDAELIEILSSRSFNKILGPNYLNHLSEFDVIFRSPGIKVLSPELVSAKEKGIEISSQIKLFFDLCPCKIIGVTGTKGKGTTSSLIYEMLKKDFEKVKGLEEVSSGEAGASPKNVYIAGNIGEPAISLLTKLKPSDWVILELSSFQLQDLYKSPDIAVILNISVDHLDYHKDEAEYHEAKRNLIRHQSDDDFAVINYDHTISRTFKDVAKSKVHFFSKSKNDDSNSYIQESTNGLKEVVLNAHGEAEIICREDKIQIFGQHNLENIAAAALASYLAGCSTESIKFAVKEFRGLPHRLEYVTEVSGIKVFDDSFSTNPEPTIAAIKALTGPKMLILGGSTKGADFDHMAQIITSSNVKAVALIGDEADRIKLSLFKHYFDGLVVEAGYNFEKAIQDLFATAKPGDSIILSPACASFDMFKNYKDRGDKFKAIVARYEKRS